MRPVFQTIAGGVRDGETFHAIWAKDPAWVPGNCLQASVASLLDLPLASVPHFNDDRRPGFGGWRSLREWARERGRDFREVIVDENGYDLLDLLHFEATDGGERYAIGIGESDGMAMHAVVWDLLERRCAHDPAPDGEGLAFVRALLYLSDPYEPNPAEEYEETLALQQQAAGA